MCIADTNSMGSNTVPDTTLNFHNVYNELAIEAELF